MSYRKNARFAENVLPSGDGQSGLFLLTSREEFYDTKKLSGVGAKSWGGVFKDEVREWGIGFEEMMETVGDKGLV